MRCRHGIVRARRRDGTLQGITARIHAFRANPHAAQAQLSDGARSPAGWLAAFAASRASFFFAIFSSFCFFAASSRWRFSNE